MNRASSKWISVKEAAEIADYHERYMRDLLDKSKVEGKKLPDGEWLADKNSVEAYAMKRKRGKFSNQTYFGVDDQQEEKKNTVPPDDLEDVVDAEAEPTVESNLNDGQAQSDRWLDFLKELQKQSILLGKTQESLRREEAERDRLEGIVEDKDRQLKLLPDFKARANEAEAYKKQVNELRKERDEIERAQQKEILNLQSKLREVETTKEEEKKKIYSVLEKLKEELVVLKETADGKENIEKELVQTKEELDKSKNRTFWQRLLGQN